MELRVGMRLVDNDFRTTEGPNRVMVVKAIEGRKAVLRHPSLPGKTYETRIAVSRIHLDGKPRKSGWSVMP